MALILIIFVNACLVNLGGQLVDSNKDTGESEDVIGPPILPEVPLCKKRRDEDLGRRQWRAAANPLLLPAIP